MARAQAQLYKARAADQRNDLSSMSIIAVILSTRSRSSLSLLFLAYQLVASSFELFEAAAASVHAVVVLFFDRLGLNKSYETHGTASQRQPRTVGLGIILGSICHLPARIKQ
jgi:hypothetical protein